MPPKKYVTFKYGDIEITIGVYASKDAAIETALEKLDEIVKNPLNFKLKNYEQHSD